MNSESFEPIEIKEPTEDMKSTAKEVATQLNEIYSHIHSLMPLNDNNPYNHRLVKGTSGDRITYIALGKPSRRASVVDFKNKCVLHIEGEKIVSANRYDNLEMPIWNKDTHCIEDKAKTKNQMNALSKDTGFWVNEI